MTTHTATLNADFSNAFAVPHQATARSAAIGALMLSHKIAEDKQHDGRLGYVKGPCSIVKIDQSTGAKSAHRLAWEDHLAKRNGDILACMTTEPITIKDIQKLMGLTRTPVSDSILSLLEDGLIGAVRRNDGRRNGYFRKGAAQAIIDIAIGQT